MKNKFVDGNIYYVQHPVKLDEVVLAKASYEDGIRFLNFFLCDYSSKIKWIDAGAIIPIYKQEGKS